MMGKGDLIVKEFPDLVKRFGREAVAKNVAVVLITERGSTKEEVTELTGLPREYVENLWVLHRIIGGENPSDLE